MLPMPYSLHNSAQYVLINLHPYYYTSRSINTTISWNSNISQYIWQYILNNITISRYCCFLWRTCIIIYIYNTTGWTILNQFSPVYFLVIVMRIRLLDVAAILNVIYVYSDTLLAVCRTHVQPTMHHIRWHWKWCVIWHGKSYGNK